MKVSILLLWKHLLILKNVQKAASNFCSGFPFFLLFNFLQCNVHSWPCFWLLEQFLGSQSAFGTFVIVTGSYQKARISSLLEGFSQWVSDVIEASKNVIFHKKTAKNSENHQQKVLFCFLRYSKKLVISWHYPFKGTWQNGGFSGVFAETGSA